MTTTTNGTGITFNDGTSTTTNLVPSGTAMVFFQASAPTGWTKSTTNNDCAIRIVTGSTGGTASGTTAFSSVFANQTPSINVSGLSVGATTISTYSFPSHTHYPIPGNGGGGFGGCQAAFVTNSQGQQYYYGPNVSYTGCSGAHSHSIAGSASSSAITLNVKYLDHIVATKN